VARGGEAFCQQLSAEREVEENLGCQTMAMLYQAGGSLLQTEIADSLDIGGERVAHALRGMVDSGRVHWKWEAGPYTCRTVHRHPEPQTS